MITKDKVRLRELYCMFRPLFVKMQLLTHRRSRYYSTEAKRIVILYALAATEILKVSFLFPNLLILQ